MANDNYQESVAPVYMSGEDFLRAGVRVNGHYQFSELNELRREGVLDMGLIRSMESQSILGGQMVGGEVMLERVRERR